MRSVTPAHARIEDVVGHLEGIRKGGLFVGHAEQVLVGNDDQGIDIAFEFLDALIGKGHAMTAFELERLGHDAHGQDARFARGMRDDRRCTGPGAAAHSGGDERHVRASQGFHQFGKRFFGGATTDIGVGPRTQALGHVDAELNASFGTRLRERLRIGVGNDEVDAFKFGVDHVVYGIATGAANTDDDDPRL